LGSQIVTLPGAKTTWTEIYIDADGGIRILVNHWYPGQAIVSVIQAITATYAI